VNVFLGLGLPWTIASIYYKAKASEINSACVHCYTAQPWAARELAECDCHSALSVWPRPEAALVPLVAAG
jgi:hypothetical protein